MIQTQFNLPIKALRSDHGGEFTSTAFSTYLLQHGIHHQFSCPHTPEQNGVAERKNRHILETARTLLHHASLPQPFWLEATTTAAYLINRLPTKTLHMASPYHKLYQKSPSYLHLKTFGCLCYPWTAYTRTNKLDPKSSPCIFIGYSSDHKGFRCFDPKTSKLIISRHVRFHEHEFPMAKQPPIPQPSQISSLHNPLLPLSLPTFYPPSPSSPLPPTQPSTQPSIILPPRHTDTHIQYQRRRPQSTNLPFSTLPPLLPLPEPSYISTPGHDPPPTTPTNHNTLTRSQTSSLHNPLSPISPSTFYPPFTTSPLPPNKPSTQPSTIPPLHHTDTHIQYHRRRPQSTTLPTSTLPPLLPLPESSYIATPRHEPPPTTPINHHMLTRSQSAIPNLKPSSTSLIQPRNPPHTLKPPPTPIGNKPCLSKYKPSNNKTLGNLSPNPPTVSYLAQSGHTKLNSTPMDP